MSGRYSVDSGGEAVYDPALPGFTPEPRARQSLSDAEVRDVMHHIGELNQSDELRAICAELLILRDHKRRLVGGIPSHLRGAFFDDVDRFDLFGEGVRAVSPRKRTRENALNRMRARGERLKAGR